MNKYIDAEALMSDLLKSISIDWCNYTVDVVEVVRCKDCKYMDAIYPFCIQWDAVVDDDGFCYMGKKNE